MKGVQFFKKILRGVPQPLGLAYFAYMHARYAGECLCINSPSTFEVIMINGSSQLEFQELDNMHSYNYMHELYDLCTLPAVYKHMITCDL